ncbi:MULTISPECIES: hypothetical protein [unclassified Mycobacterium]|uniref:hypothetical protein n=1 Tax=unclassified Mycobacterium TaxID=2642494 RepID=UPI0007FD703A|nr:MULTISPECIES: hypothetical protein [unclassified Mycobacterium]OBG59425.1 hypothetical protein A5703_26630 [Mycobacterium sp. E188]OBH33361.1 hypothetical protein A5691_10490 [Mycobacterium sp. E183]
MRGQGHQDFVDELAGFAAGHPDPRVTAIAERTAAPLAVLVRGRPGVGRGTVARALARAGAAAGIAVSTADGRAADVVVQVLAEVAKPEDADAIAGAGRPVLAVLNKADLVGSLSGGDGPIAAARSRCAELTARIGVPMLPVSGLLAVAALDGLDDSLWSALRTLAAHPGAAECLDGSFTGFLAADNPLSTSVRMRLLNSLDLFGIALGVAAARQGRTTAQLRALMRRTSGIDAVLSKISVAGAEARYRRVLDAAAELEALAVGDETIGAFLSHDDTVVARMAAAVDLAEAAGLNPGVAGPADWDRDPSAHLPRAVRWQRYSRTTSSELHRACGDDIARGSMRLWSRACGSLPGDWR